MQQVFTCDWCPRSVRQVHGQFAYGLDVSMVGIVAARCDPAAAQWAVVRVGMRVKKTDELND
eukprot:358007-Chlamydomonas_euryale.AAC.8